MKTCLMILLSFLNDHQFTHELGWVIHHSKEFGLLYTWEEKKEGNNIFIDYLLINENNQEKEWLQTGTCTEKNKTYKVFLQTRKLLDTRK